MKLIKWVLIIAVFIVLPAYLYSQGSETAPAGVKVAKIYGKAYFQKPGEQKWEALAVGKVLGDNYLVRTEADSYVELETSPGNQFIIKESSRVGIKNLAQESGVVKLTEFDLLEGEILAKLDNLPKDSLVRVSSPTAVAGARGTTFGVRYRPAVQVSSVAVLADQVLVTSVGEPQKQQLVNVYQKVTVTPWQMAMLQVRGAGVLSEKILGQAAVAKAERPVMEALGVAETTEAAKDNACVKLARMITSIAIDPETRIEDILNAKPSLCQPLYSYIAKAELVSSTTLPDQKIEVTVKLSLAPISEIIQRPLPPLPVVIKPITLKEYGERFGALARVTTQRAAQLDGYRKLAEAMYGTVINATTTLHDYEVKDDRIATTVAGVVKGAEIIATRYFSDGSISVVMTIRADLVKGEVAKLIGDIFGTNYFTSPRVIAIDDYLGGSW